MATKSKASKDNDTGPGPIDIDLPERRFVEAYIIGATPLIYNAMSEKAKRTLLLPGPPKNRAERAGTLKHEPIPEYRNSVYRWLGDFRPTRLIIPATAFKGAMMEAALDLPGVAKTQIGRLAIVRGVDGESTSDSISVFGTPQLLMSVVRNSDPKHTPDIRTRAILAEWCCRLRLGYTSGSLTARSIVNLSAFAGMIIGVGDWRQGKGKGPYGQFELVDADNEDWQRIAQQGREIQDAALLTPQCYDHESESLLAWYDEEIARRGREPPPQPRKKKEKVPVTAGNGTDAPDQTEIAP